MDVQAFITLFPEFNNLDKYPQETIQTWLDISTGMVNARIWGKKYDLGVSLLTAHNLYINNTNGNIPKILDSKSVDSVSAGYNVDLVTYKDKGFYNQSNYGIRFYQLMRIFGAGAFGVI